VFEELDVVDPYIVVAGVVVFLGVVDELVFVVIEVVLAVGVRQCVLKHLSQSLGFKVEVEKVYIKAMPECEVVLAARVEFGEFAGGVEGQISKEVQPSDGVLFDDHEGVLVPALFPELAVDSQVEVPAELLLHHILRDVILESHLGSIVGVVRSIVGVVGSIVRVVGGVEVALGLARVVLGVALLLEVGVVAGLAGVVAEA